MTKSKETKPTTIDQELKSLSERWQGKSKRKVVVKSDMPGHYWTELVPQKPKEGKDE